MTRTLSWKPSHDGDPDLDAPVYHGHLEVGSYHFDLDALYLAFLSESSPGLAKLRIKRLRAAHEHGVFHLVYLLHIVATSLGANLPTNKREAASFLAEILPDRQQTNWPVLKRQFRGLRAKMRPWFQQAEHAKNPAAVRRQMREAEPDLYRLLDHLECLPGHVKLEDAAVKAGHAFHSSVCALSTYGRRVRSSL
jgi:hypothetical protein